MPEDIPDISTLSPVSKDIQEEPSSGEDSVSDDEIIYRSIKLEPQFFRLGNQGEIKVSASAFNDRKREPSFYRKNYCDNPPYNMPPRMNFNDAVAEVLTGTIREQNAIIFHSDNEPKPIEHKVDVRPETDGHHKAHVVVFTAPEFKTTGGFAKLKEFLAQIVGSNWAIHPGDVFLTQHRDQIPKSK